MRGLSLALLFPALGSADLAVLREGEALGVTRANSSSPVANDICDSVHSLQCYGDDLKDIGPVGTHQQCCDACKVVPDCHAWTWNWQVGGHCFLKSACGDRRPGDAYHSGFEPGPAPGPAPPAPPAPKPTPPPAPPAPTPENPMGIWPKRRRSDNFFLIIGDWGKQGGPGGCQARVAQMMKDYVARYAAQGKKCLFVGSVGDNFYATGLGSDDQWYRQWANVYGVNDPSSPLHDIPWLSVMGNHDMGNRDPGCACGQGCKQFNGAHRPGGTERFWMPDYYWNYYIPGVDLEVIGMDTNARDVNGLGGDGAGGGARGTFAQCGGGARIQGFLSGKQRDAEAFLERRAATTTAKTALIMQHYDGPIGADYKGRFEGANGHRTNVLSAYGHRHDQVCEGSRARGCDVILTGGGAGWQGGAWFGFTAVHLTDDGGFNTVLETGEVRIPQRSCAYMVEGNASSIGDDRNGQEAKAFEKEGEEVMISV